MARVKICGHTNEADVAASIAAGVDAIGVIVDVPVDTPREVDVETAASLLQIPPFVTGVLVTMPETPEDAIDLVERLEPDALQVHSGLAPDELATVADTVDIPLLVGASVEDEEALADLDGVADAVLLDSRDESGAGGTGRTHDWDASRRIRGSLEVPVILAGGLTPENVGRAVETVDPYAVDVATGVESKGGVKDHPAVEQFVRRAKRAEGIEA